MEYREYIRKHKPDLLDVTSINPRIIASVHKQNIISDVERLDLKETTKTYDRNDLFWDIIITRSNCWNNLIGIFLKANQNSIVKILEAGERDDISDRLYNDLRTLDPIEVEVCRLPSPVQPDDFYKLKPNQIGAMLLINILDFDDKTNFPYRRGAENDTKYMRELWKQLGYDVFEYSTKKQSQSDVEDAIQSFLTEATSKMEDYQSCVVYFGTHGEEGILYTSDGGQLKLYEDLILRIANDDAFFSKPKLFFIQSCQIMSLGVQIPNLSYIEDTIICFPTLPGDYAERDIYLGAYFTRTLTDVFMKMAYNTELSYMLNEVRREMMTKFGANENSSNIPYYRKLRLNKLYFNVSRRNNENKTKNS